MKYLLSLLLLALPFTVSASGFTSSIFIYDVNTRAATRFDNCFITLYSFKPRNGEASYLYADCPGLPDDGYTPGQVTVTEDDEIEEVGIVFGTNNSGYLERLDCYLENHLISSNLPEGSEIYLECGRLPEVKPSIFRRRL